MPVARCMYYSRGFCAYGTTCRFSHERYGEAAVLSAPVQTPGMSLREYSHSEASSCPRSAPLRVVSYNILADSLAQEHAHKLYRSQLPGVLSWPRRRRSLVGELRDLDADVICLQEVEHFAQLRHDLRALGYQGRYLQRTGGRVDGLATFWKPEKLCLVQSCPLRFAELGLRDNVAQVLTFGLRGAGEEGGEEAEEEQAGGQVHAASSEALSAPSRPCRQLRLPRVVVGNVHVLFNPQRGDVKLGQVRSLLASVSAAREAANQAPALVCGDFNSAAQSGIHRFLAQGELELGLWDRRHLSGQVEGANRGWAAWRDHLLSCRGGQGGVLEPAGGWGVQRCEHPEMEEGVRALEVRWEVQLENGRGAFEAVVAKEQEVRAVPKAPKPWTWEELAAALGPKGAEEAARAAGAARRSQTNPPAKGHRPRQPTPAPAGLLVASHGLPLRSAYEAVTGSEPLFTTCHDAYVGTVDYIWYTADAGAEARVDAAPAWRIRPRGVHLPPALRTLRSGLPCQVWPSDHIALVADFDLWRSG